MSDLDFNARFRNWVKWATMKGLYQSRTGSAEGLWRSPQVFDERLPRPDWLINLNEPDAIVLNRAYTSLARFQPTQARVIKVLWFKPFWRPSWQAQAIGCTTKDIPQRAYQAKQAMRELLTQQETGYRNSHVTLKTKSLGENLIAA